MLTWVDGQLADSVTLTDRGLAYGDGLFETIKVLDGQPQLFSRHLLRLEQGCTRLRMPFVRSVVQAELLRFAAALGTGVMKLILTRGTGVRGYALPQPTTCRRIVLGSPLPAYAPAHAEQGVELYPCQTRLGHQPLLAGLKHLNRLEQVLARAEWDDPRYAEGLVCDVQGRVIEGVFSNVFIVSQQQLITPRVDHCGVAGVMRAEVLAQAVAAGIDAQEQDVSLERLQRADEVFLSNSLFGVWPVRKIAECHWPVGPLTRKLQSLVLA